MDIFTPSDYRCRVAKCAELCPFAVGPILPPHGPIDAWKCRRAFNRASAAQKLLFTTASSAGRSKSYPW